MEVAKYIEAVPQFKTLFGEFIDGYLRTDYAIRNLPAMRIYQEEPYTAVDNWFVDGSLTCDIILPASIRRGNLHVISDLITGAVVQQFRRESFFKAVQLAVPGLNYLGQSITVSKNRAFGMDENGENPVPAATCTINFRIDLRQWDDYLESDGRTVDDPFERTLSNLTELATIIDALNDDGTTAGITQDDLQSV